MRGSVVPLMALTISVVACSDSESVKGSMAGMSGAATAGKENGTVGSNSGGRGGVGMSDAGAAGAGMGDGGDSSAGGIDVGGSGAGGSGAGESGAGESGAAGSCAAPGPEGTCLDGTAADATAVDAFSDSVYLVGTFEEGQCGAIVLQAFWPTITSDYVGHFNCQNSAYSFRRSDQALFYSAVFYGLYQRPSAGMDLLVPTPGCVAPGDWSSPWASFGFDDCGGFYYQCADTIRRFDGALVSNSIQSISAVLPDGRLVVSMPSELTNTEDNFAVLSPTGVELARLNPRAQLSGAFTPDSGATTVSGNRAYVLLQRVDGDERSLVAYRLNEKNVWQLIRNVPVADFGYWRTVISDGTIFIRERDPATTFDERIRAFLPSGEVRMAWREAEQTHVRAHGDWQLLVGPTPPLSAGPASAPLGLGCDYQPQSPGPSPSPRANELSSSQLEQFCAEAAFEAVSAWREPAFVAEMCPSSLGAEAEACRARYAQRAVDEEPQQRSRCLRELVACDRTMSALGRCAHDRGEAAKVNERNRKMNSSVPVLQPKSCGGWLVCATASQGQ